MVVVRRGDIWLTDLNPTLGNDITNRYAPTVSVLPLTSNLGGQKFPINILLKKEDSGLKKDSLVLCGQIRTISKARLIRRLSKIKKEKFNEIERALSLYLGFRNFRIP
ncbi:MAG TPA: type II toxin-antitoxin system PemK/MazF family toxin [Methanosarcinales archaeon]|nr:type II toxin-antitoxin system PemK/MazF family toxin [Methanosarcinales archaeon]